MREYTVVGLITPIAGELLVAGVFEGHLCAVDACGLTGEHERFAGYFAAESPEDAERQAVEARRDDDFEAGGRELLSRTDWPGSGHDPGHKVCHCGLVHDGSE